MAMVLQQTSTFYDGRKTRKLYAVIWRDLESVERCIMEWIDDKSKATGANYPELLEWMRAMVERLNQCPRLEQGEAGRFYALRYRRPASMKRVCGKCAIQKGETNA